jgi:putative transposase
MATRRNPEQIQALLKRIATDIANGDTVALACRKHNVSEQSYYRWRQQYQSDVTDMEQRVLELEAENRRLEQIVLDLTKEKKALQEVVKKKW